jgi:hypothetical protein
MNTRQPLLKRAFILTLIPVSFVRAQVKQRLIQTLKQKLKQYLPHVQQTVTKVISVLTVVLHGQRTKLRQTVTHPLKRLDQTATVHTQYTAQFANTRSALLTAQEVRQHVKIRQYVKFVAVHTVKQVLTYMLKAQNGYTRMTQHVKQTVQK